MCYVHGLGRRRHRAGAALDLLGRDRRGLGFDLLQHPAQELLGQVLEVTAAVRAERGVNLIASPNSFRS
jgi:hypothetical protein